MVGDRAEELIVVLEDIVARCSNQRRAAALRKILTLYLGDQPHHSSDLNALDEVLIRLSGPADVVELASLSEMVAKSGLALPKLIQRLAHHRESSIAGPVLKTSDWISEPTLLEIVEVRSQEHLLAVSWRSSISERVSSVLVTRGNLTVHRNIIRNPGARFSERGFSILLKLAERDEDLAEALACRADVPPGLIRKFLTLVAGGSRTRFLAAASVETRALARELLAKQQQTRASLTPTDYAGATVEVRNLGRIGQLTDARVSQFAVGGDYPKLVAALALLSQAEINNIEDLFYNEKAEGLAAACKAARLQWHTTVSILRSRPDCPLSSQTELDGLRELFETLSLSEAQRRVRFDRNDNKMDIYQLS